jgi:hemerythrin
MERAFIPWQESYMLGIQDIDFQHHYFLNLINRLIADLRQHEDPSVVTSLVSELNAYARFHFISEENMMLRAGYPRIDEHKLHHRQLLDQLSLKQLRLDVRQSEEALNEIIDFLVDWFVHHSNSEDRQFADYLREHAAVPPSNIPKFTAST